MDQRLAKINNIITFYIVFLSVFFLGIVVDVVFELSMKYSFIELVDNLVFAIVMTLIFHYIGKMNNYNYICDGKSLKDMIDNNSKIKKIEFKGFTICYNHFFSLLGYGKAIFITEEGNESVISSQIYINKEFPNLVIK